MEKSQKLNVVQQPMKKLPTIRIHPQMKASSPNPRREQQIIVLATPCSRSTTAGTPQKTTSGGSYGMFSIKAPINAGRTMDETIQSQPHAALRAALGGLASGLVDSELSNMALAIEHGAPGEERKRHQNPGGKTGEDHHHALPLFESCEDPDLKRERRCTEKSRAQNALLAEQRHASCQRRQNKCRHDPKKPSLATFFRRDAS